MTPTCVGEDGCASCLDESFADRTFDGYRTVLAAGAGRKGGPAGRVCEWQCQTMASSTAWFWAAAER